MRLVRPGRIFRALTSSTHFAMPRSFFAQHLGVALALSAGALVGASRVYAQDAARSPCTPRVATGEGGSNGSDPLAIALSPAHPAGLVDWDVRWWQRHRFWITLSAANHSDRDIVLAADVAVDRRADGRAAATDSARPLVVPAGGTARERLNVYVPDDAKTLAVLAASPVPADVAVSLRVECSDVRFDAGQGLSRPAANLLDETLKQYFAEHVDVPQNPRQALETVQRRVSGAQDDADVAWAVRALMRAIGDTDSDFLLPGEKALPQPVSSAQMTTLDLRDDGIAWLRVFGSLSAAGASGAELDAVERDPQRLDAAARLHERIAAVLARHPRGWIIDLRYADGDDLWSPLAALTRLLQGPTVGAFAGRDASVAWIVDRGAARLAGGPAIVDLQVAPEAPYVGPIAVLVGPHTRDAGEAVAVAFEGRPGTRFFGAPTAGGTALGLRRQVVEDGATLQILVRRMADRNGVVYRGGVTPDEPAPQQADAAGVVDAAAGWIADERKGSSNRP